MALGGRVSANYGAAGLAVKLERLARVHKPLEGAPVGVAGPDGHGRAAVLGSALHAHAEDSESLGEGECAE